MNISWTIARHTLKTVLKDKTAFIWMLLVPTLYIFIFGSAFKHQQDPRKNQAYLAVMNKDRGFLSSLLLKGIRSENISVDSLKDFPEEMPTRLLIIPKDFTEKVLADEKTVLKFNVKSDAHQEATMTAKLAVQKSYIRLLAGLVEVKVNKDSATVDGLTAIENRSSLISVNSSYAGQHKIIPSGFNQQVPANIVMFTLLVVFLYAGQMVLDEKRSGVFRRVMSAPVHHLEFFSGKLLGGTLIGIVQIAVLVLIGRLIFGVYYGPSPLALILLAILFAACVSSIGLTLGMVMRSEEKLTGVSIILAITLAAISGCWWPVEVAPRWMAQIASFTPSGVALAGFHQLISYGRGLSAIIWHLVKLSIITLFFTLLFWRTLSSLDPNKTN